MSDWPQVGDVVTEVMISPYSEFAMATPYAAVATAAPGSVAGGTANLARFYPFYVPDPIMIVKAWWHNGTTVNLNTDVGIYDEFGRRLVSSGAVAQATGSVLQEVNITDTYLCPGRYYMGLSTSSAISTYISNAIPLQLSKIFGWCQMATAHPLPATVTFAALANNVQPVFGCAGRVLVV